MLGGINVLERIDSSSRGGDLRLEAINLLVQGMSPALHVESPWLLNMKRKSQARLVVVVECEQELPAFEGARNRASSVNWRLLPGCTRLVLRGLL